MMGLKRIGILLLVMGLFASQAIATGNESKKDKKRAKNKTAEVIIIPAAADKELTDELTETVVDEYIIAEIPGGENLLELEIEDPITPKKEMTEAEEAFMIFCNEITDIIDVMDENVGILLGEKKERKTAVGTREYWVSNEAITGMETAEVYYSYVKRPNQWYLVMKMPEYTANSKAKFQYNTYKEYLSGCLENGWANEEITTQFGTTNKFNKNGDDALLSKELYLTLIHDNTKVMLVVSKPD